MEGLHGVRNWGGILASRRESVLGSAASSEKITLFEGMCHNRGVIPAGKIQKGIKLVAQDEDTP